MKTKAILTLGLLIGCALSSYAQRESGPLPRNPMDIHSKLFELLNPGAAIVNRSSKGTIYKMPLDNMAVLVPATRATENMPGASPDYRPSTDNMPNPLYPPAKPNGKKH